MSSAALPVSRRIRRGSGDRNVLGAPVVLLGLVGLLALACSYAAFDRGDLRLVMGAVVGIELLALCVMRPRSTLLLFMAVWGVVHVLLSNGEVEKASGAEASASQLIGVIVIVGFGIAALHLHGRRRSRAIPISLAALTAFTCLYGAAELITPLHRAGLSDLVKLVGGLVLAFVTFYAIDDERRLLALTRAVAVAGVSVAAVAIVQAITGSNLGLAPTEQTAVVSRATSVIGSPNGTADFLLVCAGFLLLGYSLRRGRRRSWPILAMLMVVSLGIIVTFTRADIVALVLMLLVWGGLWRTPNTSVFLMRLRLALVVVAVLVGVVQVVGSASLIARVEGRLAGSTSANVLNGREAIWSNELHKFESGSVGTILVGSGAHSSYTSVYIPQSERYAEYPPHNLLLWLLIETGVIGLCVYAAALFTMARSFLRTARRSPYAPSGRVAAAALGVVLAFALDSMFHNTQLSTGSYWYFMVFVGAALRMIEPGAWVAGDR